MLVLAGCGDGGTESGQSTNSASSGNPLTAPVDYLGAMGNAKKKAVGTVDVSSLTKAVQMFHISEGRFPKDLEELVTLKYMAKIPEAPHGQKIVYDPATGQVTVAPE